MSSQTSGNSYLRIILVQGGGFGQIKTKKNRLWAVCIA